MSTLQPDVQPRIEQGAEPDTEGDPAARVEASRTPRSARRSRCQMCLLGAGAVLVFTVAIFVLLLNIDLRRPVPDPRTGPIASPTAPGVGFDLTPSYGTAAVRHHNGSVVGIVQIIGDADYLEMMQRFSTTKSFTNPWEDYCGNPWNNNPKRLWEIIRRNLGLPSTADVGRLVDLLAKLQHATEQYLGHSITAAVVTTPMFPGICVYDLVEAIELNGIYALTEGLMRHPHEISAAFAGNDLGLCTHFTDIASCKSEEQQMPVFNNLAISYTNTTLVIDFLPIKEATFDFENEYMRTVDYSGGSNSLPNDPQEKLAYWDRLRVGIVELVSSLSNNGVIHHIDNVFFIGESANDPTFQQVVKDAILRLQADLPMIYDEDPLYIAARGAAEFAKRKRQIQSSVHDQLESENLNGDINNEL